MLSTASVITYSKYISNLQANSSSRAAKFVLKVEKGDICSVSSPSECNLSKYKPYDMLDYKFNINTLEVEVSTLFVITIKVNDDFTIEKLYVDDEEIDFATNLDYVKSNNTITITQTIGINNVYDSNYSLRISYNGESTSISDAVIINYAATQID